MAKYNNQRPAIYYQTDSRWRYNDYSASGEKTTIGASGCGPTSMAMVLASWADKNVTPATECKWALNHGYKCPHSGTYYGYFVPAAARYGLSCTRLNTVSIYGNSSSSLHKTAQNALAQGNLVIACMGKGTWTSSGHYIVVYDVDTVSNVVYINDPASSKAVRVQGNYSTFKSQVKYYWVVKKPNTITKEDPDMTETEVRKIVDEMFSSKGFTTAVKNIADDAINEVKPTVYNAVENLPYGKDTIAKLIEKGILNGTGTGLGLEENLLRALVICDRAGVFDSNA